MTTIEKKLRQAAIVLGNIKGMQEVIIHGFTKGEFSELEKDGWTLVKFERSEDSGCPEFFTAEKQFSHTTFKLFSISQ